MKHLVLVVGAYYPQPSPTGKCVKQFIKLLEDDYRVGVVFMQYGLTRNYNTHIDNQTLYGLFNLRLYIENWFIEKSKMTTNLILISIYKVNIILMKTFGFLQSVMLFPNNLRWFYKKAFKTLSKIHKNDPIDVVFTVNSPFPAHLAGEVFKKKYQDVRWITYTVDPFYIERKGIKKTENGRRKAFNIEKRILEHADANLMSEEVFETCLELYKNVINKTYSLPYLLTNRSTENQYRFDPCKINLVYTGRFYKDIRNPEYMLKTILLTKNKSIVLHIFGTSDCDTLIFKYVKNSSGRIVKHGLVDSQEVQKILYGADIMVNVGNSLPEFKPSKVFEYIATGKPIINFYQNGTQDDTLKQYPLSLQISTTDSQLVSAMLIDKFCDTNKGKLVSWDKLEKIYYKHTSNHIMALLRKVLLS